MFSGRLLHDRYLYIQIFSTICLTCLFSTGLFGSGEIGAEEVIAPGQENFFRDLVDQSVVSNCGYISQGIEIRSTKASYHFVHKTSNAKSVVILSHPSSCSTPFIGPKSSFCVEPMQLPEEIHSNRCTKGLVREAVLQGILDNNQLLSWTIVSDLEPEEPRNQENLSRNQVLLRRIFVVLLLVLPLWTIITLVSYLTKSSTTVSYNEYLLLGICFIAAFFVRRAADVFPANIRYAGHMAWEAEHLWAASYSAFQTLLYYFSPPSLETLATGNLFLGCLTVFAVYILIRIYFKDGRSALAGSAVVAFHPLLARYSVSDSAHVFVTLALCASLCCGCLWASRGSFHLLLQAVGWLVLAGNARMEAVVYGLSLLAVLVGCVESWSLQRLASLVVAGLLAVGFLLTPIWQVWITLGRLQSTHFNILGIVVNAFFWGTDAPKAIAILALVGIGVVLGRRSSRWRGTWWLLAIVTIGLPTFGGTEGTMDATYRYFLPMIGMYSCLAGVGLSWTVDQAVNMLTQQCTAFERWFGGTALVKPSLAITMALMCSAPNFGFLRETWTYQLEWEFVRAHIGEIDDGCSIVRLTPYQADSGLEPPRGLSREVGRNHRWVDTTTFLAQDSPLSHSQCVIFYESASCYARDTSTSSQQHLGAFVEHPECQEIKERFHLEPLWRTELRAKPYVKEVYAVDPVPVGFYRLSEPFPG